MKSPFFLIFSLCWFTINPAPSSAQDAVFYVFNQADAITFYQVDAAGEMTQVGALPPNIGIWMFTEVEWTIPAPADIVISPDYRHVAFVAYRDEQDVDLFIYTLETDMLTQVDLPGVVSIHWSPVGDALFMSLPEIYYEFPTRAAGYLYDLTTSTLTMMPDFPAPAWLVTWLPDNETLVFTGSCVSPCNGWNDIYMLNRSTLSVTSLTDHSTQLPSNVDPYICYLAWSEVNQRVYYEVGCPSVSEPSPQYLYSVDLNGISRLEAALPEEFPNDRVTSIRDIRPSITGDIFLAVKAHSEIDNGQTFVREDFWRVIRVTGSGQFSTVIEYVLGDESPLLIGSRLSSEHDYLALYGGSVTANPTGNLIVVELENNTIVQDVPDLQPVCTATWFNGQILVYTEFARNCHPWTEPVNTSLLNVETGVITPVAQDLPGFTWLLLSR